MCANLRLNLVGRAFCVLCCWCAASSAAGMVLLLSVSLAASGTAVMRSLCNACACEHAFLQPAAAIGKALLRHAGTDKKPSTAVKAAIQHSADALAFIAEQLRVYTFTKSL
jgi:hypothetical protein